MSKTNSTDFRASFIDRRISPFLRDSHEYMLEAADLKAHTRILVVECRDGWAAEEARRRVSRGYVCGVDRSDPMLTLARQYRAVEGKLEFESWDRASLPLPDGSFDVALVPFSVHRFPDPGRGMAEIARVLRPGGRILVLESTRYSFLGLYVLLDWMYRFWDPGHVRYYSVSELLSMIRESGFDDARVAGRFTRLRSGGKWFANATLVESRIPASEDQKTNAEADA